MVELMAVLMVASTALRMDGNWVDMLALGMGARKVVQMAGTENVPKDELSVAWTAVLMASS